jgi:hypothetical protein
LLKHKTIHPTESAAMKQQTTFRSVSKSLYAALISISLSTGVWAATVQTDAEQIREVLMKTWDKPEARLQVNPVSISGDYALASWQQGERGGRAVLARRGHHWTVTVCGGEGIMDPKLLSKTGMELANAQKLVRDLRAQEATLDQAARKRFASFSGWVPIDSQGAHPAHPAH